MLIEISSLETRHREGSLRPIGTLARLKLGETDSAQTYIKMKAQLAGRAGLTVAQARELCRVAEKKFNGMITNDKFCCTRWSQLQLSWWRRPLRLRS
jgi:hypothetical protein